MKLERNNSSTNLAIRYRNNPFIYYSLYRNSQLSKRVEILQEDIQTILTNATTTATKKIKRPSTPQLSLSASVSRSSSTTSLPNSIAHDGTSLEAFAADLSNKITENERLHNEIFEQTSQNRTQVGIIFQKTTTLF